MSRLATIKAQKLKEPPRILVYGVEGIGKTTLAAAAPAPIWFDVEGGSGQLSVARYPFRDGPRGHVPDTLEEVRAGIQDLATADHRYQTLVIDTADSLEKLVHKFILERDKPKSKERVPGINAYGYGKGQDISVDELRALTLDLEPLRQRGMSVIILAHQRIRNFKSPVTEDYDRYTLRMDEKAAGFLREWCDVVGFACFEETTTDLLGERAKGVDTGRRLLKFRRSAVHDAKSRYALPDQIEMSLTNPWEPFAKALSDAQDMTADQLTAAIRKECERIGDDITTQKAENHIKNACNDTSALQRILAAAREKQSVKGEEK